MDKATFDKGLEIRKSVLGAEFYVMKRIGGVILRKDLPEGLELSPVSLRAISAALIDTLADLHALDYGAIGLGDLGKPEGYVARQVTGWTKRYAASRTDDVPAGHSVCRQMRWKMPSASSRAPMHLPL